MDIYMQEEGWVVCRAFKKPSPSHKQGFEAWTSTYYIRENSNFRPPPISLPERSTSIFATNSPMNNIEGTNFQQVLFGSGDNQELILSSSNQSRRNFDNINNHLIELPQLDSPSINSTSLATNDQDFDHQDIDQKINNSNIDQYNEWKIFDKLLVPQVIETSSYAGQDEMLLGCFTDL